MVAWFLADRFAFAGFGAEPGTFRVRPLFEDPGRLLPWWLSQQGTVSGGFDPDTSPCGCGPWVRVEGYEYLGPAPGGEHVVRGVIDPAGPSAAAWVGGRSGA